MRLVGRIHIRQIRRKQDYLFLRRRGCMQIAKMYMAPIDDSPRETKLIANYSKVLPFSTLMQGIIDDKTTSTQETANQKQSDPSCDCDKSLKQCKCDSDKEAEEVAEAKKSGIAACMECPNRTNGQCDMWNGEDEDSISNLLSVTSNKSATQDNVARILDIQTNLDVIAKASQDYDYTNAYAYIRKKLKIADIG